ncbi:MAG: hypothetical protein ACTS8S_00890 [Giesbergeria sp.]
MEKGKSKAAPVRLSSSAVLGLSRLGKTFTPVTEVDTHPATRKSLVIKGLAVMDASGNKIKITAQGSKVLKKSRAE